MAGATTPCLVFLCAIVSQIFGLHLNQGAYEDLVIRIPSDIPSDQCREIITNLESTLSDSSQYIFQALDGRAYIRSVTIVLPNSWPNGCATQKIRPSTGKPIDITLVTKGQSIWTQQSAGCGQQGDQIYLNYKNLLDDTDSTLSRLFIKEFAKYRYGVFDEKGYVNDQVYPICYHGREEVAASVTGCSDLPIKDHGICEDTNAGKNYNVTKLVDPKARSSIMFAAEASSVSIFCDEGNHDRYAPTKHNFMCDRRSTLDVILQHRDFLTQDYRPSESQQITNTTPTFSYVKPSLTRYVLVIEDTQEMLVRESWTYLRNAVRKWAVYDLPTNSEVALIMVNETSAATLLQPTLLANQTQETISSVASNIPYIPADTRSAPCLHCAIAESLKILQDAEQTKGPASSVILLIASGMEATNSDKAIEQAKLAAKSNVKIATINYPGVTRQLPLDKLAEETNGSAYTVFERKQNIDSSLLTTYFDLTNVMYDIMAKYYEGKPSDIPIEIHRKQLVGDGRSISGSFVLDENMREPARFALYTHNIELPLIKSVSLWSPSQILYSRRTDVMINVKIITLAAQLNEPGTWTYRIERYDGNPQPHFVQVMATPRVTDGVSTGIVNARLWTKRDNGVLTLYCEVKKDLAPVLSARVEVHVTKPESNGSIAFNDKFELTDSGGGDPDVTRGDGIYSRYFAPTEPGAYTFEVTVTDNGNTAYSSQDAPNENCCGSFVPPSRVQPLNPFQRVLAPFTMHVTSDDVAATYKAQGGRIGDLKVKINEKDRTARLIWTAPDMAGSNVARYEIKYAKSVVDIADKFETSGADWEYGMAFPLAAGAETTFTLNFSMTETANLLDIPLYFAIKAYPQRAANDPEAGRLSNWVRVLVPKPAPVPTILPPTYPTLDHTSWPHPDNGYANIDPSIPGIAKSSELGAQLAIQLPIIIGVIILAAVLVFMFYMCVIRKRNQNKAKKSSNKNDKLQSAITIVPSSPAHSLNISPPQQLSPPQENHQHAYTNDFQTVGVPINYNYDDEPKKRYSLVHQQEQQLIEELKQQQHQQQQYQQQQQQQQGHYGTNMNVSIISGPQRTLSPYESWTASQLLHEHERRHSPMEEMLHPQMQQDQYNIIVPPPVPPLPSYNGYPVNYGGIYGVHPAPPPFNVSLQGSITSVNSAEKKKRNVTMV